MKRLLRERERGSVLGMAAISMAAILLAAGLAIDVGHWYLVSGELQNAADAAALAAASALDSTSGGITQAVDRAVASANRYEFNNTTASIARTDVRFAASLSEFDGGGTGQSEATAAASPSNIRFVQVTVPPKSVSVFLAQLATNSATITLSRKAIAGQSVDINYICNIVPLMMVENSPTATSPVAMTLAPGTTCGNSYQYTSGCLYVLDALTGSTATPGNYFALNIGSDRGGSDLRTRMATGTESCYTVGQTLTTEPGGNTGTITQGLNVRFDDYQPGLDPVVYPPDANIMSNVAYANYGQQSNSNYFTAPPNHPPGVWGRRVLIVPIATPDQYNSGRSEVTVRRFGAFFLREPSSGGGRITVEYLGERIALGNGGYVPGGGTGSPGLTVAVLYR